MLWVSTDLRLKIVGMLTCNKTLSRHWFLLSSGTAAVKLFLFDFLVHSFVIYIISVFNTVPRILSDIVVVLFRLAAYYVVWRCLLVVYSHLIQLQTALTVVR